jgi:antagonist of KipI
VTGQAAAGDDNQAIFEVVEPGLLTTVQDDGRPGLGHLGVPTSGAADPWSLAVANRLLGNDAGAAALELTLLGPTLRVLRPIVVALAGADLGATIEPGGRRLRPGRSQRLAAGVTLDFPPTARRGPGFRAVLAVPGGFDVPIVLGSRSTCLAGGFGGLDGRPLRPGDRLAARPASTAGGVRDGLADPLAAGLAWPDGPLAEHPGRDGAWRVRVLAGPGEDPGSASLRALAAGRWTVLPASDRMGLRLDGPSIEGGPAGTLTHGVTWGTVQLPPDGRPIVLLADHQPTGGYPVVAVAITADRPVLGQAGPGDRLRFELATADDARAAEQDRRAHLAAGVAALRAAADADEPWRSARG